MLATPHPPDTDQPDIDDSRRSVTRALTLIASFRYAFTGIGYLLGTQRNAKIHCAIGTIAIILGIILPISRVEWTILIVTIALVLAMEGVNTAIEAVVDLASPEYHALAKVAKDVAAGTVLLAAIASVVVGIIIFLPHLWTFVLRWLQL